MDDKLFEPEPEIKTLKSNSMKNAHIKGVTADAIKAHFENLYLPAIRKILPKHRYNMNKISLAGMFLRPACDQVPRLAKVEALIDLVHLTLLPQRLVEERQRF